MYSCVCKQAKESEHAQEKKSRHVHACMEHDNIHIRTHTKYAHKICTQNMHMIKNFHDCIEIKYAYLNTTNTHLIHRAHSK